VYQVCEALVAVVERGSDCRLAASGSVLSPFGQRHVSLVAVALLAAGEDVADVVASASTDWDYVVRFGLRYVLIAVGAAPV